jgi:ribose-phosphate pyrophosphokinase
MIDRKNVEQEPSVKSQNSNVIMNDVAACDQATTIQGELARPRISEDAVVFSLSKGDYLTERIIRGLRSKPGNLILEQFPNGETRIEIHESVRDRHAFVIGSVKSSVNEMLVEVLLLTQALKLADASRITIVLPYFPYSRQDRKTDTRPPISARAVTDLLKAMGAGQLVTVDLHATQVEGFFDGPFENLSGLNQLVRPLVSLEGEDLLIVSPDAGGAKRAEKFARQVESNTGKYAPLIVMSKFRPGPAQDPVVVFSSGAEVLRGKTCVLVDDMIDTGGSIEAAARALKQAGAERVVVCASHGIFSNDAVARLRMATTAAGERAIDRILVTDTLPVEQHQSEFVTVVSVAPLITEAITRLDMPRGSLRELKDRVDLGELVLPERVIH